jgi:hypothetical protein
MGDLTIPMWAVGTFVTLGLGLFAVISSLLIRVLNGIGESTKDLKGAIDGLKEVVANHHTQIELLKATKADRR